jgi:hypothetical protein
MYPIEKMRSLGIRETMCHLWGVWHWGSDTFILMASKHLRMAAGYKASKVLVYHYSNDTQSLVVPSHW